MAGFRLAVSLHLSVCLCHHISLFACSLCVCSGMLSWDQCIFVFTHKHFVVLQENCASTPTLQAQMSQPAQSWRRKPCRRRLTADLSATPVALSARLLSTRSPPKTAPCTPRWSALLLSTHRPMGTGVCQSNGAPIQQVGGLVATLCSQGRLTLIQVYHNCWTKR